MTFKQGLVLVEVDALEGYGNKTLLSLVKELADSELAVLYVFLFHEA